MLETRTDLEGVIIVGGGPAGLIVARELAGMGLEVDVYTSEQEIGERAAYASGILSAKAVSNLGLDVSASIKNSFNAASFHFSNTDFTVKSESAKAFLLDRKNLSKQLASAAMKSGARIFTNRRMSKELLAELSANHIIVGADGAVSTVASTFGFPPIERYVLTYKAEYKLKEPLQDKSKVEIFFSRHAKGFFGWLAPHSYNKIEVGIGIDSVFRTSSKSAFSNLISGLGIDGEVCSEYASLIPLSFRRKTAKGNVLLVGDAAGQTKASTGGGIAFNTVAARLAASSIYEFLSGKKDTIEYEKKWKRALLTDMRIHSFINRAYSSPSFEFMVKLLKIAGMEKALSNYGNMDSPSDTIKRIILRRKMQ
ncbi:MAG: FAD-dependent monooxygenase [Candidatus Micrarchaeia archaeon]